MFTKYNYYEVQGENRILRQVVQTSKDIKKREPIEEYRGKKWQKIDWKDWCNLPLSYLTDAGAKRMLKKCAV